jgi:hypothetical protein
MIRSRDNRVTCVRYVTPPDSNGKRLSGSYKKFIKEHLIETGNKDLELEDFVTARKVLGLSSEFEIIKYSDQPSFIPVNDVEDIPDDEIDVGLTSLPCL